MSCCGGNSGGLERHPGTGCCGTSCSAGKAGCLASEPRIRSCFCQENVGCLDRADCGGFRPRGTAATGACPGPCQCVEEEAWNRNVPPKPNCEWLTNFSELRRQWSDHGRQNNCKCCNCKPCRTAAPCKPCLPLTPTCSVPKLALDSCQDCCNMRLSGGACGQSVNSPSPCQRDCSPTMYSSGGECPPPSCNRISPSACSPSSYSSPCSSPSECTIPNPCATPCRPPSSCQPCSPSARPILKKRSCCQCISGYCMCQPMPRNCNCPPPVQVDARAERECSCECPSSPECACPPSERKFPRTKVKCPNARMCCSTPRPQPGPKCSCIKCQPCLPPPCDPCTSSICRTVEPKVKPCCGDSLCPETSPCRPNSVQLSTPTCRPTLPCTDSRKTSPPCLQTFDNVISGSRPGSRFMRLSTQPRSTGPCCGTTSATCRSTGQSWNRLDRCDSSNETELESRSNEGYGDDDGEAVTENPGTQCHCGSSGSRECDYSSSFGYDHIYTDTKDLSNMMTSVDESQCGCGNSNDLNGTGCAEDCDYCCSINCDSNFDNFRSDFVDQQQCACGANGNVCAESCNYCCSQNCDSEVDRVTMTKETLERIGAGGADSFKKVSNDFSPASTNSRFVTWKETNELTEILELDSSREDPIDVSGISNSLRDSNLECSNSKQRDTASIKNPSNSGSACKLLRSLIRAKSPMKYLQR